MTKSYFAFVMYDTLNFAWGIVPFDSFKDCITKGVPVLLETFKENTVHITGCITGEARTMWRLK